MPRDRYFVPGSFYRSSDFSGMKTRAENTEKMWNGYWVRKDREFEERNAQDFVRGVPDDQSVPEPRPQPINSFVGPLITTTTAAQSAGGTALSVQSSVRMFAGDTCTVMLSNGVQFTGTLLDVPSANAIVFIQPFPWSVASGAEVEDLTANVTVTPGNYPPSNGPG